MQYSEKVLDHFTHPRNVGEIEDANGVGEVGNAKCGDIMKIYLKVSDDGIIEDDIEKTIRNLGRIGSVGMQSTDTMILDIMSCK